MSHSNGHAFPPSVEAGVDVSVSVGRDSKGRCNKMTLPAFAVMNNDKPFTPPGWKVERHTQLKEEPMLSGRKVELRKPTGPIFGEWSHDVLKRMCLSEEAFVNANYLDHLTGWGLWKSLSRACYESGIATIVFFGTVYLTATVSGEDFDTCDMSGGECFKRHNGRSVLIPGALVVRTLQFVAGTSSMDYKTVRWSTLPLPFVFEPHMRIALWV